MQSRLRSAGKAARGVALIATNASDLVAGRYHGTDKLEHGYVTYYRRHFSPLRLEPLVVYEIGVGGVEDIAPGGSLPLWRDYFVRSTIVGIDLHHKEFDFGPRVVFEQADQNDPGQLSAIVQRRGLPHVVIDDGSHVGEHVITSFRALWPHVRPGGWYVIEDLATSYDPAYGGAQPAPDTSGVGLLKALLDDVQARDPAGTHHSGPSDLGAVHCYPGIAFIRKSGG